MNEPLAEKKHIDDGAPATKRRRGSSQRSAIEKSRFPDAGDPNCRVVCNEIANELAKNWRFKLQVSAIVIAAFVSVAAVIGGLIGWSLSQSLATERERFQSETQKQIADARSAVQAQIAQEFNKENVQKTVEGAAGLEAGRLLAKSVDPAIKAFQSTINEVQERVDRRSKDLEAVVDKSEHAAEAIEALRGELTRLKERNDLSALADRAISEGDVGAYRKLEEITGDANSEQKHAAVAELFRIYQAYSIFSGVTRTGSVKINTKAINPKKSNEEELDADDLLPLLEEKDPAARIKTAELLTKRGLKAKSFKTSEALYSALKKETHLEAYKYLGTLLQQVIGHEGDGKLDRRELIKWYEDNREQLRKEDTDATPTPSPVPSPSASSTAK